MSSTQSSTRFSDENYKNWLKTAESLYILRNRIQNFIEKETETYHSSLRNKQELNGKTCHQNCNDKDINQKSLCQLCECWRKEIVANHNGKCGIHWNNCKPNRWSTDKWEVAKAYMPRGHRDHCEFSHFDVAAILNFMNFCKHFSKIQGHHVRNVINVRNNVMHSPDLKMSNEDMKKHHSTILLLANMLQPQVPELNGLEEEIKQYNNTLDQNFNKPLCEVDGQQINVHTRELLDRENQALKDKIKDIISSFEGNQEENVNGKLQDFKHIMDFLDQNKDLLENLGPEVNKLKEIQTKVDELDEEVSTLKVRMDQLEKEKQDPLLPGIPPRYKNHLFEFCRAKKWLEPVFTETQEAQGYRGKVTVNGQSFTGIRVFNDKKGAHQEVACIALEQMKSQEESTNEPSSSVMQPETSCSSSSGIYFGKVTVDLNLEVESERCPSAEEASEAVYKILWESFHLSAPVQGQTHRSVILEYFNANYFQKPSEYFVQNDDNTTSCKLKLIGPFTFYDKDGSTKKKLADQQAAKVALQHLSGIFNCAPISETEKNFKGILKECLETRGLKSPNYTTVNNPEISEKQVAMSISPDLTNSAASITQAAEKEHSELKSGNICKSAQLPVFQEAACIPVPMLPDPQDSSSPAVVRKKPRIDCLAKTFFGKVTVNLKDVMSERCSSKEEAAEAAYKNLMESFCINAPAEGQTYRSVIIDHFGKYEVQQPIEEFDDDDNNTTICILKFSPFIFYDKDGSTKKKQAEQQAASVALDRLSGIFNCAPVSDDKQNFKGVLKEFLESLGHSNPIYDTKEHKGEIREEPGTGGMTPILSNLSISQSSVMENVEFESISTSVQLPICQESVNVSLDSSVASMRKKPRIDCPEINELLRVYNLMPHVEVENVKCDQGFKCTVKINLEEFTCANKQGYDTKKEAIRKTYLLFGCAVSILNNTDEKTSIAMVKMRFSQNSLPLPQEDVEGSSKLFYCSLKNINYTVDYDGEGSSEDEAKLLALQKALRFLSPLFNYPSLPGADHPEEVLNQLSSILKGASQKDPIVSLVVMNKACVQLSFCDYTMKCTCQSTKKAARNHLSARILGLLGIETDANNANLKNQLDVWFTKNSPPKPVFEDTEVTGAKATFSVQITSCSPDWEENWETAKMKLLEVLKNRFQFLDEKNY